MRNVFEIYSQRHEARSAVTALPLGLSKNVFEIYSQKHVAPCCFTHLRGFSPPNTPRCFSMVLDESDQLRVVAVNMANPGGSETTGRAKAGEPYQNFDGEGLPL